MDIKHIIEPERQGLWIAVTFIVALLALTLGFASLHRTNGVLVGTQAEVLFLNNKIEQLKANSAKASAAPAAPAVAATETPAAK